jgi:hypothetical protein
VAKTTIARQPLGTSHNQLRANHPRFGGVAAAGGTGGGKGGGVDPVDSTIGGLHHDQLIVEAKNRPPNQAK